MTDNKYLQLAAMLKLIDRERAKQLKFNAAATPEMSRSRLNSLEASSSQCGIEIRRLKHEAHCLAVEIGIADRRSDAHYTATTAPAGMGRDALIERREPEVMSDTALLNFLADPSQQVASVQLPTECVERHPDSLRMAIMCAMTKTHEANHD